MGFKLNYVKSIERLKFLKKVGEEKTIFVGDGIFDLKLISRCKYGISTNNAIDIVKEIQNLLQKEMVDLGQFLKLLVIFTKRF